MTKQEIIGDMDHFYIGKPGSLIANMHKKLATSAITTTAIDELFKDHTIEVCGRSSSDESKLFSIRSYKTEENEVRFLAGFWGDQTSIMDDISTLKLAEVITQDEFLSKYRELEDD